jgi:hypothetical protein
MHARITSLYRHAFSPKNLEEITAETVNVALQELWRLHAGSQKLLFAPELQDVLGEKAWSDW